MDEHTALQHLVYTCIKHGIGRAGAIAMHLQLDNKLEEIERHILYLAATGHVAHREFSNGFYD